MSRRPSSFAEEAADALFRLASAAGLLSGLVWAVNHPAAPKECADTTTDALGRCVGDTIWASVQPYVFGAGGGALAGALLALAVIVVVRFGSRALRRRGGARTGPQVTSARPIVTSASVAQPRGRSMIARYAGSCSACRAPIRPGDRITHLGRQNNRCASCG